jgi:hypothetical protein
MPWQPINRNGKAANVLLTDEEKERWKTHPSTKRVYTSFQFVEAKEIEPKKPKIPEPIEAKDFTGNVAAEIATDPKKPKEVSEVRIRRPRKQSIKIKKDGI